MKSEDQDLDKAERGCARPVFFFPASLDSALLPQIVNKLNNHHLISHPTWLPRGLHAMEKSPPPVSNPSEEPLDHDDGPQVSTYAFLTVLSNVDFNRRSQSCFPYLPNSDIKFSGICYLIETPFLFSPPSDEDIHISTATPSNTTGLHSEEHKESMPTAHL